MPTLQFLLAYSHPHLPPAAILTRLRLRLPATNSQTKQNDVPRGATAKPRARKRHRSSAALFAWFSDSQSRRPYITQLCLTPLIYCLGDFSAQMIGDDDFDYRCSLRSMIIGLVIAVPSYKWFLFLGQHFNYRSPALSLGAKVATNQLFYTPMFNVYFFAFHGLLAGDGLWGTIERVKDTVPTSIPRSFLYWPLVTAFNFSYVSPHSRAIATSVFAVFWQSYLSWLNSSVGDGKGEHPRTYSSGSSGADMTMTAVEELDRQMLIFDDT
ncbi:hypothetical protein BJY01DRAFT_241510 [Aspergillus pseudoustus]|uniref:Uncharacterized protein n=1 Tax=Aspergillus pseudoustus TaxID=1810923 RepID=A0ABR4IDH9_9EURO